MMRHISAEEEMLPCFHMLLVPQLRSIQLVSSHERIESCADEKTARWWLCLPDSYGLICSLRVLICVTGSSVMYMLYYW